MSRIDRAFEKNQPFIGYLTGGDGGVDYSVECALALVEGGVDLLEIGLPFSDPIADGPTIQRAHERSLACGTNSSTMLQIAKRLRQVCDVPLVLFSYYNPLLQRGKTYLDALKSSGFDALLIVDLPLQADRPEPFFHAVEEAGLLPILLATPSTDEERLRQISKIVKGFLYYVSQKGTTGVRSALADDFCSQIARLRPYVQIPIVAGFGIADRITAASALQCADGFVVGSALVEKIEERISPRELTKVVQSIDPRRRLK